MGGTPLKSEEPLNIQVTGLVEAKGLEPSNLLTASQALYQLSYAPNDYEMPRLQGPSVRIAAVGQPSAGAGSLALRLCRRFAPLASVGRSLHHRECSWPGRGQVPGRSLGAVGSTTSRRCCTNSDQPFIANRSPRRCIGGGGTSSDERHGARRDDGRPRWPPITRRPGPRGRRCARSPFVGIQTL